MGKHDVTEERLITKEEEIMLTGYYKDRINSLTKENFELKKQLETAREYDTRRTEMLEEKNEKILELGEEIKNLKDTIIKLAAQIGG